MTRTEVSELPIELVNLLLTNACTGSRMIELEVKMLELAKRDEMLKKYEVWKKGKRRVLAIRFRKRKHSMFHNSRKTFIQSTSRSSTRSSSCRRAKSERAKTTSSTSPCSEFVPTCRLPTRKYDIVLRGNSNKTCIGSDSFERRARSRASSVQLRICSCDRALRRAQRSPTR